MSKPVGFGSQRLLNSMSELSLPKVGRHETQPPAYGAKSMKDSQVSSQMLGQDGNVEPSHVGIGEPRV